MLQAKEPVVKENKNALVYRKCAICNDIIADASGTIFEGKESTINERFCSSISNVICKACTGEECPQNYKHEVISILGGNHYCKQCKKVIEKTNSYKSQISQNTIKVDEPKIIYDL